MGYFSSHSFGFSSPCKQLNPCLQDVNAGSGIYTDVGMYVCMYTYYTYICICVHTSICRDVHIHMLFTCLSMYVRMCTYIHLYIYTGKTHAYIFICMHYLCALVAHIHFYVMFICILCISCVCMCRQKQKYTCEGTDL